MNATALQQIAEWCDGRLLQGDGAAMIRVFSTDTRTLEPGSLFVPLTGENFDGHQFLQAAADKGAAAAFVSKELPAYPSIAIVLVEDTLQALQRVAAAYRKIWGGRVLGLTGSTGKTSTKDLVHSVLSRKFSVWATPGNLNNHIGLPLTVLGADSSHEMGVFEMGMNHPGELAPLAAIAAPNAALITNIGTAHIEFMKTREAIAVEKSVVAEAVPAEGCVILNADDDFTDFIAGRCRAKILRAGFAARADVRVSDARTDEAGSRFTLSFPDGETREVRLPLPGRHMIGNAALAAAAGYYFQVSAGDIAAGLEAVELTEGRVQLRRINGILFIDDSYNSNPDSARAALDVLAGMPCEGRRVAVLGRMAELGECSREEHLLLGKAAVDRGVDMLCAVGPNDARLIADGTEHLADVHRYDTQEKCAAFLADNLTGKDVVLVKGSRSAEMERVLDEFQLLTCSTGSTNS